MKEYIVSYDLAKKLKDKGFIGECFANYDIRKNFAFNIRVADCRDQKTNVDDLLFSFNQYHQTCIDAPTISQVASWLRADKHLHIEAISASYGYVYIISRTPDKGGADLHCSENEGPNDGGAWDDVKDCYVAAIEYCLNELI